MLALMIVAAWVAFGGALCNFTELVTGKPLTRTKRQRYIDFIFSTGTLIAIIYAILNWI